MAFNFFASRKRKHDETDKGRKTNNNDDDTDRKDDEYENNKRTRKIQISWLKKYSWLRSNQVCDLYNNESTKKIMQSFTDIKNERAKIKSKYEFTEVMFLLFLRLL